MPQNELFSILFVRVDHSAGAIAARAAILATIAIILVAVAVLIGSCCTFRLVLKVAVAVRRRRRLLGRCCSAALAAAVAAAAATVPVGQLALVQAQLEGALLRLQLLQDAPLVLGCLDLSGALRIPAAASSKQQTAAAARAQQGSMHESTDES